LGSRLLYRLSRGRGDFLSICRVASPDEPSPFVIDDWVHIEDFFLQVLDIVVIDIKASLDGTIRDPSLAFEQVKDLGENFVDTHGLTPVALAKEVCIYLEGCMPSNSL
jgi:hypothetical protein